MSDVSKPWSTSLPGAPSATPASASRGKSSTSSSLTALILTLNEEIHIQRSIESVAPIATRIVVVDSGSTDNTVAIATALGAHVFHHSFRNQAEQVNWALDHTAIDTEWVLRLDADEYLTPSLRDVLPARLTAVSPETEAFTLNLRRMFMGKWLRHGGLYPIRLLRVWRARAGRCEERWMDEHVSVAGKIEHIEHDFADHNLNSLTWWTDKHNRYACREAVELLNLEYRFLPRHEPSGLRRSRQAAAKRFVKERVYARLPGGSRAFVYFLYRYLLRAGFLDGRAGAIFHVLQGFWYRYLVDAKVAEVQLHMRGTESTIESAILHVLGIDVRPTTGPAQEGRANGG